jgi:hypothetical protein
MNACESLELEMEMNMVETKEKNVTLQNLIHLHLPCQDACTQGYASVNGKKKKKKKKKNISLM